MSEFPRHYLQACLLLLLSSDPSYGYDLRDRLPELGLVSKDWGQLYRTLRAMERDGLVLSCWEQSEAGPSRRTYHVTDRGTDKLTAWAEGMLAGQDQVSQFLRRYQQTVSSPWRAATGGRPGRSEAAG